MWPGRFGIQATQGLVTQIELLFDLVEHRLREADVARFGTRLEPRRDIHTVAEQVIALDHHIIKVHANAKLHPAIFGQVAVTILELPLDFYGATHRLDRAGELGDHAVAGAAEHPPTMVSDQPVDDLSVCVQHADRRFLVGLYQSAVAGDVSGENGGEPCVGFPAPP